MLPPRPAQTSLMLIPSAGITIISSCLKTTASFIPAGAATSISLTSESAPTTRSISMTKSEKISSKTTPPSSSNLMSSPPGILSISNTPTTGMPCRKTKNAAQAGLDEEHSYNEAVTIAMKKELEDLQVQSRQTAWNAAEKMRGIWFDGLVLVDMKERNLDIGLDDGFVTPVLVPGLSECENA